MVGIPSRFWVYTLYGELLGRPDTEFQTPFRLFHTLAVLLRTPHSVVWDRVVVP